MDIPQRSQPARLLFKLYTKISFKHYSILTAAPTHLILAESSFCLQTWQISVKTSVKLTLPTKSNRQFKLLIILECNTACPLFFCFSKKGTRFDPRRRREVFTSGDRPGPWCVTPPGRKSLWPSSKCDDNSGQRCGQRGPRLQIPDLQFTNLTLNIN